jgi:hypothetical protein
VRGAAVLTPQLARSFEMLKICAVYRFKYFKHFIADNIRETGYSITKPIKITKMLPDAILRM